MFLVTLISMSSDAYIYIYIYVRVYVCYFVWRQQGKYQLWANCFMRWMPVQCWTGDPRFLETPPSAHCSSQRLNYSPMTHPSKNGLAPTERYHTLVTTANLFYAGTILHWAAYPWHWRIDIILYEGDMRTCLRSLAAGKIPIMSELRHEVDASVEPGTPEFRLSPVRRQAITWNRDGLLILENFSEIVIKLQIFCEKWFWKYRLQNGGHFHWVPSLCSKTYKPIHW